MGMQKAANQNQNQLSNAPQKAGNREQQYRAEPEQEQRQLKPNNQRKQQRPHLALEMDESPPSYSTQGYGGTGISRESLRKGFVRKVLVILILQLAISAIAIGVTFIDRPGIKDFLINNRWLLYAAVGVMIVTLLVLMCKRDATRKVPMNYILLIIVTLAMSYILAVIAAFTESDVILFAGGFTVGIVFAVAAYATFTKTDLSRKGYFISGLVMIILLVLIFCLVYRSRFLNIVYSGLVGLLYIFFLAYDIQRLVGKYESQYSMDEYINAALDLYIDIIQIFLLLLGARKNAD